MDGEDGSARRPGSGDGEAPSEAGDPAEAGSLTPDEFEQMVLEIHRPLMSTALRLSRRRAEAEDLVQETLYRAFRSLGSFRKGSRFRAWMFRILHNVFVNRIRRESMAPTAVDPVDLRPADHDHPEPDTRSLGELPGLADHHFDDRVKAAVDGLSETFRIPLVLFALGDLSYQEIADALDIPIGTVMSRLHRGRRQIREELAGYAAEHGFVKRDGLLKEGDA